MTKTQHAKTSKSERGLLAFHRNDYAYVNGDSDVISFLVDTIDIGAGSVHFAVNNTTNKNFTAKLYAASDPVGTSKVEIAFKDEAGTETLAGVGRTMTAGSTWFNIVLNYSSYPEASAFRYYILELTPAAAITVAGTVTVAATLK